MKMLVSTEQFFFRDKQERDVFEKLGFQIVYDEFAEEYVIANEYQVVEVEINSLEELIQFTIEYGTTMMYGNKLKIGELCN